MNPGAGNGGPAGPELDAILVAAAAIADGFDDLGAARRAEMLEEIAAELERAEAEITGLAAAETALGEERLHGELARTCLQLRSYGAAAAGSEAGVAPEPGSSPQLVRDSVALGVVAVFGAGNFPLAFGALGTDTAAALAAGCPVVVKGHPGHPRTSAACVAAAHRALDGHGLRDALALVQGGTELALALTSHPRVAAVAFTGSPLAGRALIDAAARRPDPIPVFAEMGSVNPVLVTTAAAARRGAEIAAQLADAVLGSAGQLCTKPGVLLVPAGRDGDGLVEALRAAIAAAGPFTLLNERTAERFEARVEELAAEPGVTTLVAPSVDGPALFELTVSDPEETARSLADEAFGPAAVTVRYRDLADAERLLDAFGGQLTISIYGEDEDGEAISGVLAVARRGAGRILWNGAPTGVAVAAAMHHGGPWPASNSPLGSVGPEAIWRFRRPLTWQGFPPGLRPPTAMNFPGVELA